MGEIKRTVLILRWDFLSNRGSLNHYREKLIPSQLKNFSLQFLRALTCKRQTLRREGITPLFSKEGLGEIFTTISFQFQSALLLSFHSQNQHSGL
jgi:hypothetical protein